MVITQFNISKHTPLTLPLLRAMPSGIVFAHGVIDEPKLFYSPLRWVAKRGDFYDWAIYHDVEHKEWEEVCRNGTKLVDKEIIRNLIPCNEAALKMYRT